MTYKIYTTLAQIRSNSPCEDGYKKLCKSLGGIDKYGKDTPIKFEQIFDSNGYDDTLWCLRTVDEKYFPLWRHFAVDVAEIVEHLMTDCRSRNALRVARLYADGSATYEELAAAWAAARDAARAVQMRLLFEYCRTGERVNWRKLLEKNQTSVSDLVEE